MPAWRARAFHITRSAALLAQASGGILALSALIAILLHVSRGSDAHTSHDTGDEPPIVFGEWVRKETRRLAALPTASPARLVAWIRSATLLRMRDEPEERAGFDPLPLRLAGVELNPLIAKHSTGPAQSDAIAAYVRVCFLPDGEARQGALHALQQAAAGTAPPYANEMLGDALLWSGHREEALRAYLRDASLPEAVTARKRAMEIALERGDVAALQDLCAEPRVIVESDASALWRAAKLTGNRRLLFRALWQMQGALWLQGAEVPLALLAAGIWYIVLIHTASREAWRWWRYLPAVFAGIASVWLLHWWQGTLRYRSDPEGAPSLTHEMLQWIMHVGLPEEAAKLALFAFFLPVLLHNRSGVKAALTAGCVGIGFALDENLHYFRDYGVQIAIQRLLTANFMHLSMTGILGWHLYELFRSRFHHATEFLTAFCLIVVAHGVYDFSLGTQAAQWGFDIASMVTLALAARFYLHLLHEQERPGPAGHAISRTSVFILGTSLLGGVLMITMVWELQRLEGITLVLKSMVGVALVGFIYIREWHELR
jgi:RsiW-degrading membrane proteinase PrsW (M82 family)